MLTLEPITADNYQAIVDWNKNKDADFLNQWAGGKVYHYPLTSEQVKSHDFAPDSRIFMIMNGPEAVGSIELDMIDRKNASAKVCRFILRDDMQNQGLGMKSLKLLAELAFTDLNLKTLTLGVFCFNAGAIRCYEKCGFLVKRFYSNSDPKWNSYSMELVRKPACPC